MRYVILAAIVFVAVPSFFALLVHLLGGWQ